MSIFDEIVARIPNKLTIDELIEIYILAGFGDVVGPSMGRSSLHLMFPGTYVMLW